MDELQQKTILLVEDEAIIALTESSMLKMEGYQVIHSESGENAIDIISVKKKHVDLILMDIDLGKGMDGTQAAQEILKTFDIPVVFLSSHTEKEIVEKTEKITSYGYVVKNSGDTVLLASIKMAFKLHKAHMVIENHKQDLHASNEEFQQTLEELEATNEEYEAMNMELLESQDKLQFSEERYRGLYCSINDGLCLHEIINGENGTAIDYRILDVNPMYERITGISKDIAVGKLASALYGAGNPPFLEQYSGVAATGMPIVFETYFPPMNKHFQISVFSPSKGQFATVFQDITSRRLAEEELKSNSLRLESMVRIMQYKVDSIQDFLDYVLDEAIRMTGSKFGYIYVYNEEKKEFVLNTWSKDVMEACMITEKQTLYELDKTGFWGEAVRQRKPIMNNNFKAPNPLKKGYPEGHAPLDKFMSVPVFSGDKIIAVVGLANKKEDYNETDLNQMILLMDSVWKAVDLKRAEYGLRESNRMYAMLLSNLPGFVYRCVNDKDWTMEYMSEGCLEITGYKAEDFIGNNVLPYNDIVRKDFQEPLWKEWQEILAKRIPFEDEYPIITASGKERWVWERGRGVFSNDDKLLYLEGFITDITARKQAEDELKDTNKRLKLALNAAKSGTWEWDLQTNENIWSEELWNLYGLTPHSSKPSFDLWLQTIHPDHQDSLKSAVETASLKGDDLNVEWRVINPDGPERWLMSRGQPECNDSGQVIRYIGVVIDITERKLDENKIRAILSEKELILKEVQHRIKNNMSVIYGLLTMQMNNQSNPDVKKTLLDAAGRIQSMKVLYDKLYRSEVSNELSLKEYLPQLVNEIISIFPQNVSLTVKSEIEDIILSAKLLSALGIIINELITNTVKYAFTNRNEGVITILAKRIDKHLSITYEDNGNCIPESVSFDNPSGFGLQLINIITKQLHGSIIIERQGGTRFVLQFQV